MTRTKLTFLSTVVLVLSAGVVVGRLSAWWAPIAVPPAVPVPAIRLPGPPPFLPSARFEELNLTPDQKQQMDAIWAETRQQMHSLDQQHDALRQERIAAVYKLLSPDQRTAYDKIDSNFRARGQALDSQRDQVFHSANERSLALLTDTQRKQWESMTRAWDAGHPRRGRFGPTTRRSTTRPSVGPGNADTAKGGA